MVFRLLLLIALPILAWYTSKSISQRFSLNAKQNRYLFAIMAALLLVLLLIMLGRLPVQWLLAPLGAAGAFLLRLLPAAFRFLPLWQLMGGRLSPGVGRQRQNSTLRTEYLAMELIHGSGDLDGKVLQGQFAAHKLSDLSLKELLGLREECRVDADSLQVLEAYLDRAHAEWRAGAEPCGAAEGNAEITMNRQLALEILGLEEGATRNDIIKAHRKLMGKFHPDRGGSDYFSKKINAAKDLLLESTAD